VNQHPIKGKEEDCRKLDEHNVIIPETKIVRDFDIVTNNYYKDHDTKAKKDFEEFKNHELEKVENKRLINIINMKYYDENKERDDINKQQEIKKKKHDKKVQLYPESYK